MNSTNQVNKFSDSLTSAKRVLAALFAGLLIMMFLPGELVARVNAYLPLHIALETGAIITATMVFVMGWHTISIRPNYRVLVMACCFFGVALLDFSHMISFDGMPDFISPSAPEKAINFWLAARLFAAVAMLAYILLPASEAGTGARWMVLAGVLLAVALFHVWFLYFPQWVPTTFDPVTGLTWFKVGSELSFSAVFAVCAVVLWQRCQAEGRQDVLDLSLACGTMAVSEIFFTIYVSVDDGYALIGHIYKIAAHGLLYRAIVVKGVKQPYREIEMLGQRIAATLDALPDMLFELSADGVIYDYHSKRHHHQLLASPEEFLGKSIELFMPPHALRTIKEAIADIDATGVTNARQYYIGEGEQKSWFELSGAALTTMSGETRYVMVVRDITERMQADIEQRIAATAFSAQEGIMITDAETRILRVNDSFEKATGYTEQEVIGKKPSYLSSGRHDAAFYKNMWRSIEEQGYWRGEIWNRRKSGEIYPQALTITAVRNADGEICNFVGDFIDISDLKAAQQKISRLSYFDVLTGLPNRERLIQILADTIQKGAEKGRFGAVLIVNLNDFKTINETIGYSAGDKLLMVVADRLRALAGQQNSVARYGGDEYVVVLQNFEGDATAVADIVGQKAQSILAVLEGDYELDGGRYYTTGCIGVTLIAPDKHQAPDLLLKQAGIALTQAKMVGRNNVMFFDPSLQESLSERVQLLADLREAVRLKQFELYLQPQQLADGTIVGVEALVRWNHPLRGMLSPAIFIPLAESHDMMVILGREILDLGLDILQRWSSSPQFGHVKLSINLAAEQFYEADFCSRLMQAIKSRQIDPTLLMLEFTESTLMNNMTQARQIMQVMSEVGIRFAIDDFGTGYSSLAYLSELPLHQLKIDQSFVRKMNERNNNRQIIQTIVDMASSLGMEVIAEGVETEEQKEQLNKLGCKQYQGYLIGKPMPVTEFEHWLQQQS